MLLFHIFNLILVLERISNIKTSGYYRHRLRTSNLISLKFHVVSGLLMLLLLVPTVFLNLNFERLRMPIMLLQSTHTIGGFGMIQILPGQKRVTIPLYSGLLLLLLYNGINIYITDEKLILYINNHYILISTASLVRVFILINNLFNINANNSYDIATILAGLLTTSLYFNDISLAYLNMFGSIIVFNVGILIIGKINRYKLSPYWNGQMYFKQPLRPIEYFKSSETVTHKFSIKSTAITPYCITNKIY